MLLQIKKKYLLIKQVRGKAWLLLFLLPLQVFAQDITGIWTGFLQTTGSQVHYELAITENKEKLAGYSLTIFTFNGVENTGVKSIKLKSKKGKISLEDDELIYNNYTTPSKRVKLFGELFLKTKDSILIMEGTFTTRSMDIRFANENVFKGTIHLQKQNNFTQTKLLSKLEEMNLLATLSFIPSETKEKDIVSVPVKVKDPPPVVRSKPKEKTSPSVNSGLPPIKTAAVKNTGNTSADITARKTEILKTVYFKSDSLVIRLFDNGQVDGDTVSVLLNGKIIISKKGLTANAITQTIYMASVPGDSLVLVMYAENLGTIPPNTGLLVLQDGDDRYEIRFAGDLEKNAAIVLKRKR